MRKRGVVILFLILLVSGCAERQIRQVIEGKPEIDPSQKIASNLKGKIPSWAVNQDGTWNVIVVFYDNVSEEVARDMIKKYGIVTDIFSYHDLFKKKEEESDFMPYDRWHRLGVSVSQDYLLNLASEDTVKEIVRVEGPKGYGDEPIEEIQLNQTK